MTLAALLLSAMALLVKATAARLPGPEVAFVRFVVGMMACGVAATRFRLRAHNWRGLFWRGAFGGTAVLCYFLAIEHLSVGMATLLNYTAPVFTAFCVAGALFTGVPAARHWVTPTGHEWGLLVGVGLTSVAGQLLMTYALRDLRASVAGVLFQLTPVSTLVFDHFLFGAQPRGLAIVGAAITLAGVSWGAWKAAAPAKLQPVPPEDG